MTVYVDDALIEASVRSGNRTITSRWSHLMADTTEELLAFGAQLGMRRRWLQHPGTALEHFDLTEAKRRRALALGATPIGYGHEGAGLTRAKREGHTFDLAAHRRHLADLSQNVEAP